MYKRNDNKGITLIALVITIIVLLILTGVSIGMIAGNNGIIAGVTNAIREKALGDVKEQILMIVYETYTDYHAKEVTHTLSGGENLYDDTKTALEAMTSSNSDVKYEKSTLTGPDRFVVKLTYIKDGTYITGTLDKETETFKWD